jgi:hypothetical protein
VNPAAISKRKRKNDSRKKARGATEERERRGLSSSLARGRGKD